MPFSTSTVAALVTLNIGYLGSILATIIPPILGILVALLALGMGITYVKRHITGSGFQYSEDTALHQTEANYMDGSYKAARQERGWD